MIRNDILIPLLPPTQVIPTMAPYLKQVFYFMKCTINQIEDL